MTRSYTSNTRCPKISLQAATELMFIVRPS